MRTHFEKLINMYYSAPINTPLKPEMKIETGECEIEMPVNTEYFHAAGALHGSIYFKMLDDAAFFAANSAVPDTFVVTANFNIHLIRPVQSGKLIAKGKIVSQSRQLIIASAELFNEKNKLVATGDGTFMKSSIPLTQEIGYY